MNNKRGVEMNFAFIFSMIVGAVILFLAIYFATSLTKTGGQATSSLEAQRLSIMLEPLELGLATGKSEKIEFKNSIILENYCSPYGNFGSQEIIISQSPVGRRTPEKGVPIKITNKYVFSDKKEEGKLFQVFVKEFSMPFKISEIIVLSAQNYCFENTPQNIKNEINMMNINNVKTENCSGNEIQVCFSDISYRCSNRDIKVIDLCGGECDYNFEYGKVVKKEGEIYYYDSLIYSAIFSDNDIYNCNVQRLIKRASELTKLYQKQAILVKSKGCGTVRDISFIGFLTSLGQANFLENPVLISQIKEIDMANKAAQCSLW